MIKKTTRERILEEAEKQFIEKGINGTQMKDIAETLVINRRTLYRYYPTKDDLAFAVEIIIMKQFKKYFSFEVHETGTGLEKIKHYFETIDVDEIKHLMKYLAEFDSYFQDDYPSKELEDEYIELIRPESDILYKYCQLGFDDGSLRSDFTPLQLYQFITHNFLALFQRVLIREKHLKKEHCASVDFNALFKSIILRGIQPL